MMKYLVLLCGVFLYLYNAVLTMGTTSGNASSCAVEKLTSRHCDVVMRLEGSEVVQGANVRLVERDIPVSDAIPTCGRAMKRRQYKVCAFDLEYTTCVSNPCLNEGSCLGNLTAFKCICLHGYKGDRCEEIDEVMPPCASQPCEHGRCVETIGEIGEGSGDGAAPSYRCNCNHGYTGEQCHISLCPAGWSPWAYHNSQNILLLVNRTGQCTSIFDEGETMMRRQFSFLDHPQPWWTKLLEKSAGNGLYELSTGVNVWTDCNVDETQNAWTCGEELVEAPSPYGSAMTSLGTQERLKLICDRDITKTKERLY